MIAEEVSFSECFHFLYISLSDFGFLSQLDCYSVRGPVQLAPALAETWENHY